MSRNSKYNGMPLQTISKKVWSSIIDGLLLLVLGVILTLTVGFSVLKSNDTYIKNNKQCFDSIIEMYKIQSDSLLQKLSSDKKTQVLSAADFFDIYINKQINLSYLNFTEEFKTAGITIDIGDNYSKLENDELAYYFVSYKLNNNINLLMYNNKLPLDFFKEDVLFKNINKEYYIDKKDDLPILKSEIAISLYKHYKGIEINKDLYYEFSDAVVAIRELGLNDLKNSDKFNTHYILYTNAYQVMAKYNDIVLFISYIISFIILILIPSLLLKDNLSIGKLLTRTKTIHKDGFRMGLLSVVALLILTFLVNAFIVSFISLFSFGFENLKFVLFSLGTIDISFLHLLLLSLIFVIINFIVILVTKDNRSLIDILTNTKQMDIKIFIK